MKQDDQWQNLRALGLVMSMGATMAAAVAVGYFIGAYIDKVLHTKPWFTIILFFAGAAAGLKSIYELMNSQKGGK